MTEQIPLLLLVAGAGLIGLYLSNLMYDYHVPHYVSRKLGHLAGGVAAVIALFLFDYFLIPTLIAALFTLMLGLARIFRPHTFRGVGGSGRPGAAAEFWFPLSLTICWGIGWGIFNQPVIATVAALLMCWGDAVTGLVRSKVYGKPVKGFWGSVAMFIVCLIVTFTFVQPYHIGVLMSIGAVVAEWSCGDVSKIKFLRKVDDNLSIPLVGLAIGLLLI